MRLEETTNVRCGGRIVQEILADDEIGEVESEWGFDVERRPT